MVIPVARSILKVCIVFTAGHANDKQDVLKASEAWAKKGVSVFAVGIGNGIDRKGIMVR